MIYQDRWINGVCIEKGKRNCADRYEIIKHFCSTLPRGFAVCDIGANMCYFSLRLIEDFGCKVIAFEFDHFDMRQKHVELNKTKNLMLLKRKISLTDLQILKRACKFDLILGLSVLHHLPGNTSDWISSFKDLGNNVILEFAGDDTKRAYNKKNYSIDDDGILLGYGESHLDINFKRPIYLFKQKLK